MFPRTIAFSLAAVLAAGCASPSASAAGSWHLNPRLCPDLREDVRDARVTYSVRDLREDRRDRRVTNCPASAFVYRPVAQVRVVSRPARPRYSAIYVTPRGHYYGVRHGRRVPIAVVAY